MKQTTEKIALSMIVRGTGDEPVRLRRCLKSIAPYVDAIYITLTGDRGGLAEAEKVCQEFKVKISYGNFLWTATKSAIKWLKDFMGYEPNMKIGDKLFMFDKARNFNLSQIPKEYTWMLWMDCDDVFVKGEDLWKVLEIGRQAKIDAFYMNYLYQAEFDPERLVCETCHQDLPDKPEMKIRHTVIEHLRERVIRNNGQHKWIAPIHETLIEQVPTRKTDNYDCYVLHMAEQADRVSSLTRNLRNLEFAIYKSEGKDPRHVYYLAKAHFDINTDESLDRAIPLINLYLHGEHKSGWPEERSQACEYLGEIYRQKKSFDNAIKCAFNAMIEAPESVSPFASLATTYMVKGDWERALFWVKIASTINDRKSTLVRNPRDIKGRILEVIFQCCYHLGRIDEAWAAAAKMRELFPNEQYVQNNFQLLNELRLQRDLTKQFTETARLLREAGETHKIKPLLQAAPAIIEKNPFMVDLYMKNNPPKFWGDNEIAIYCGAGFTNWSPKRLSKPGKTFVGGSEEAVILMTEELAKLGWSVTVYADPGDDEGEYDGVKWLPYYKFNKLDNFNILISWRQPALVDNDLKAKRIYCWCHDIQNPADWTKERLDKYTKIIFLSKWHASNVPNMPEDKILISSNGI
mgnify:CR=1 FL=1